MSGALDMSLEDIIKSNKKSGSGNSWGRGSGSGTGPTRRIPYRCIRRTPPGMSAEEAAEMIQTIRAMFDYKTAQAALDSIERETILYISNLDYGVSNEDIKELFSEVGDLRRYSIHYDRSGRSKGTAEVAFSQQTDAVAAVKRYNNVQLDGKPMKIEITGTNIPINLEIVGAHIKTPATIRRICNHAFRNSNGVPRGGQGSAGAQGWVRGGGSGRSFGRGPRQGRGHGENVSAEALDADLEEYHKANMETN